MSDEMRFQTTAIIWVALAAVLIFADTDKIALGFILGIAAAISTSVIWESKKSENKENASIKHKRDDRVRRLIEVMDEDEIADMQEYLQARRDDRLSR
jgi:hypothetical protein